jgi:hypothetical protein
MFSGDKTMRRVIKGNLPIIYKLGGGTDLFGVKP